MRGFPAAMLILAALVPSGMALAQETAPKSPAAAPIPVPQPPEKPESAADAPAKPAFPAKVNKDLFCTNDYRGRQSPEIKVEQWLTPAGKPVAPDRSGKVTLVDFWATWCPPCRALIPELNAWQKEFKDDLVVIGISSEPADTVKSFMGKVPVGYAMAFDSRRNGTTKSQIGIAGIPHVLVIDSTGIVRWQGFPQGGDDKLTTDILRQIIAADKAQRTPKKPEPAKSSSGDHENTDEAKSNK